MHISIILNCHSEGKLIHRTMNGIERMRSFARERGIETEVIAILDNPTQDTISYSEAYFPKDYTIHHVAFKDLGLSRNYGVEQASGKYVAFHDADDLYSKNWLTACYDLAESLKNDKIVLHAQYSVTFGTTTNELHQRYSQNEPGFHCRSFFDFNPYDALAFAPKNVFLNNKYGVSGRGAGYEDWHWNLNTFAAGYVHYAVPNTVLFIRRKREQSLLVFHLTNKSVVDKTPFFEPSIYMRFFENAPAPIDKDHDLSGLGLFRRWLFILLKSFVRWAKRIKKKQNNYYFSYKIDELLKAVIPIIKHHFFTGKRLKSLDSLPSWLVQEMRELNPIEPEIIITETSVRRMHQYVIPYESVLGESYYEICKELKGTYDHVFVGPWLKTGGADLVTLKYINAFVSEKISQNVLLILTENTHSEWLDKLPKNVTVFKFGERFGYHSSDYQQMLLLRILIQFGCTHLHLINSKLAYDTVATYGKLLTKYVKIYPHTYCYEIDSYGNYRGYAFAEQNIIYPYVTKYVTENKYIIDFLTNLYAYDKEKFVCVYQPVDTISEKSKIMIVKHYVSCGQDDLMSKKGLTYW